MEFKNESMGLEMRPNRLELVPINEHYMHSGPCSTWSSTLYIKVFTIFSVMLPSYFLSVK